MSRAYLEAGDGEKKLHKATIRCKGIELRPRPLPGQVFSAQLEITTNAEEPKEPFIMEVSGGEVFTVVIEE